MLGSLAAFVLAVGLVLRAGGGGPPAVILAVAGVVALTYPFVVDLRAPRTRPGGQQRWRTLVARGEMAAVSCVVPTAVRHRPRGSEQAFGRLSVPPTGWRREPDPQSARIGFGPIELPRSWRVVDQGRSRSGVFASHITLRAEDGARTVTFRCTAPTAAEVLDAC